MRVLILCIPCDRHAFAAAEVLRTRGNEVLLWYTGDFPTRSRETFDFGGQGLSIKLDGPEGLIDSPQIDTVWNRRLSFSTDFSGLQSADVPFVSKERQRFRDGSLQAAFRSSFWVNSWRAARDSENKLFQQAVARELGIKMPEALFTNDPAEIKRFIRHHGGTIIYKPLSGLGWSDGETSWACHTISLTEEQLVADHLLTATPGIYQRLIPKAYELRITMVGHHVFGAKIFSQETQLGKVDWRRAYRELRIEAVDIEPSLARTCRDLLEALGLVFGCFDFIVTPEGELIFLEVNQMGQFLFIEQYTGLPLLAAFTELLTQGRADFRWASSRSDIRYSDVQRRAHELAEQSKPMHEPASAATVPERPGKGRKRNPPARRRHDASAEESDP